MGAIGAIGCADTRRTFTDAELLEARRSDEAQQQRTAVALLSRAVAHVKSEHDLYVAGKRAEPPCFDFLVISGGGDWGAFGAGYLRGWSRVKGPLARPEFTVVTGVSTGSLIAPFAFLGDEESLDEVERIYRNPETDWVKRRLPLWFLPYHASFATVPGLEREVKKHMPLERVARIAETGQCGRVLIMNTTNVDDGTMHIWDIVAEAERAVATGDPDRVHRIMLASSGIPGAFPYRIIDGAMHVDGGVTGNIVYGGRLRERQTHIALWRAAYPDVPVPRTRFWIVFNNQFRGPPLNVDPTWPAVVMRSVDLSTRWATLTSIRHLVTIAELSRQAYKCDFEVRVAAIPDEWRPPKAGTFIKETMNDLANLGERMGEDPSSWVGEIPQ